jgi:hypothetical protein
MEIIKLSASTYYKDLKVIRSEEEEWAANIRGQIELVRVEFKNAGYRT